MTTLPTMTLTEFLLARIAEDETRTRAAHPFDSWANHEDDYDWDSDSLSQGWHTGTCGWRVGEGLSDQCGCGVPARVLAECEAKRQIIRWVTDPTVICEVTDPILQALGLPYADHPDFREVWTR